MLFYKKLIKVSLDDNNNKFWEISLNDNNLAIRKWGRVGAKGSSKEETLSLSAVKSLVQKKEKEGYVEFNEVTVKNVNHNLNNNDLIIKFLNKISEDKNIQALLKYFLESNIHTIVDNTSIKLDTATGLFKTPLGFIDLNSINEADILLDRIYQDVSNKNINDDLKKNINKYLSLIPQKVGLKIDIFDLFGDQKKYDKQKDILEALKSSLDLVLKVKTEKTEKIENPFKISLELVKNQEEIDLISKMYSNNKDLKHPSAKLKFKNLYYLNIDIMSNNAKFNKGNKFVKRLWHGTRVGNLLSIFKNGMKIISSNNKNVTGRMFGDGLYFSDISTKALNYSIGTWNNTGKGKLNKYFGIICDVYMEKTFNLTDNDNIRKYPVYGYDSTFAKKGVKNLQNNEMIVYSENQVIPVYLVEFEL